MHSDVLLFIQLIFKTINISCHTSTNFYYTNYNQINTCDQYWRRFNYIFQISILESNLKCKINRDPPFVKHPSLLYFQHSLDVILFLVASYSGDVRTAFNPYPRLHKRIAQLGQRLNDNNVTDIIIFHTGYPFRSDYVPIFDVTPRHVEFVNVDHLFNQFPRGFEPHRREPTWSQRGKWNYHHMCYFWFKQVFELKIVHRYRYMMRLDDDSQLLGKFENS